MLCSQIPFRKRINGKWMQISAVEKLWCKNPHNVVFIFTNYLFGCSLASIYLFNHNVVCPIRFAVRTGKHSVTTPLTWLFCSCPKPQYCKQERNFKHWSHQASIDQIPMPTWYQYYWHLDRPSITAKHTCSYFIDSKQSTFCFLPSPPLWQFCRCDSTHWCWFWLWLWGLTFYFPSLYMSLYFQAAS